MDKPIPSSSIDNDETPSEGGNTDIVETLHQTFNKMFTKEHLETDTYLRPHLSSQLSLPIDIVVESPLVKCITSDRDAIEHALRTSNSVVMLESTVRPNIKVEQHTIILRDVSSDIGEANIVAMFRAANCGDIIDCRSEMNKTWFVTFATEDAARSALINIRSSKLGDSPVRARLKTESTIRSYYQPVNRTSDPNKAKATPDGAPSGAARPPAIATDFYNSGGQHPLGPSPGRGGPPHQNGTPPGMPQMGYYMYPHYGHMAMPMPGGSPMFMGGMWPPGMSPVMPMMPMMQPHHTPSPVNGGRGGGRGRHSKSSPRNYHQGGGKGAPNSPNGQRSRGNSYGSKGHAQQGQQQQSHHASPYAAYGHVFQMPSPDGREHVAGPVAYDVMGNPIMHMAVPPPAVEGDDTKGKALKEGTEEGSGKGDKNKKKNAKNKKKDKSNATGTTAGGPTASTIGAGGQDVPSSGDGGQPSGEKKGKGENGSKGSGTHRDREQSGGGRGVGGGGGGNKDEKRSPRGGRGGAKGDGKILKAQPEFNMEADFPTLGLNAHGNAAHPSAGGVSWAAAIMKSPVENIPLACAPEDIAVIKGTEVATATAHVLPKSHLTDTTPIHTVASTQQQLPSEAEVVMHGGKTTNDDAGPEAAVGVVFGDATAWMDDSSASTKKDFTEKTAPPPAPHPRQTSPTTDESAAGFLPISFGAFDQQPADPHSKITSVQTFEQEKSNALLIPTEERPLNSLLKSGGDKQKRTIKGSTARSRDGHSSSTSPDRNGTSADKGDVAAEPCASPPGNAWGANPKMSFLDVVRGGGNN